MLSCVWLFETAWTTARQLLCSWNSPDKNIWVGCHSQSISETPVWPKDQTHVHLLYWQMDFFYHWATWEAYISYAAIAVTAKSLQLCLTLWDPIDGSPSGSPIPEILQARVLEWVSISFSNSWKWKVKVKSLSCVRLLATAWTAAHQATPSMRFSRQEYWSGVLLPSLMLLTL